MNLHDLETVLVKTTKILAGEVDVHLEGFAPRVEYNPKTKQPEKIYIPALPENASPSLIPAIHGYIDHEVSHVMFSNNDDICDKTKTELWHYVHNCIEDPRVNKKMGEFYSGSKKNIKSGYNYLFKGKDGAKPEENPYSKEYVDKLLAEATTPEKLAEAHLNYSSLWFARTMGDMLSGDKYDELDLDRLFGDLEAKMDPKHLKHLKECSEDYEVRDLSDYYEDFFSKEALDKLHPKKKDAGKAKKGEGESGSMPFKTLEEKLSEKLKWEIEEAVIKAQKGYYWTNRFDKTFRKKDIVKETKGCGNVSSFENEVKQISNYIAKDLRRLLEERRRRYYVGGYKSGKLNTKKLSSVRLGNDRVFKKKNEIRDVNASVSLLIDMSGSMNGQKVKTAMLSAYAFAMVLDTLKIPFEIAGFVTDNGTPEMTSAFREWSKTANPKVVDLVVNAFCPEHIYMFKAFEENFDLTSKQAMTGAGLGYVYMCQNEDSKHVKLSLERLSARPERVKSLFVFSDGVPAFHTHTAKARDLSYDNLRYYATKAKEVFGVDVYSIGIVSQSVKEFYPKYKIINKVPELPTALFEFLRKTFA